MSQGVAVAMAFALALLAVRSCDDATAPAADADVRAEADPRPVARVPRPRAAADPGPTHAPGASPPAEDARASDPDPPPSRPPAQIPPRADVPADAVPVEGVPGLRAWAVVTREPRGLAGEPGASPGRLQVHLSRPVAEPLVLRFTAEPDGAVRGPRGGLVRIERGRDFASVPISGVSPGPATVVHVPAASGPAAAIRVRVDVRSIDEFADPVLAAVAATPGPSSPGALLAGERMVRGLAGTAAGAVRVLRSGFRGFRTEPTVVLVGADDPEGILGAVPPSVTIAAGETEIAEPIPIRLRDATGRATLRFRSGAQEVAVEVESVAARWSAPAEVVVGPGRGAVLSVTLDPATASAPDVHVSGGDGIVRAAVRPADGGPHPPAVLVDLVPLAPGEAVLRLRAPPRPDLEVRVVVRGGAAEERAPEGGAADTPRPAPVSGRRAAGGSGPERDAPGASRGPR